MTIDVNKNTGGFPIGDDKKALSKYLQNAPESVRIVEYRHQQGLVRIINRDTEETFLFTDIEYEDYKSIRNQLLQCEKGTLVERYRLAQVVKNVYTKAAYTSTAYAKNFMAKLAAALGYLGPSFLYNLVRVASVWPTEEIFVKEVVDRLADRFTALRADRLGMNFVISLAYVEDKDRREEVINNIKEGQSVAVARRHLKKRKVGVGRKPTVPKNLPTLKAKVDTLRSLFVNTSSFIVSDVLNCLVLDALLTGNNVVLDETGQILKDMEKIMTDIQERLPKIIHAIREQKGEYSKFRAKIEQKKEVKEILEKPTATKAEAKKKYQDLCKYLNISEPDPEMKKLLTRLQKLDKITSKNRSFLDIDDVLESEQEDEY